MLGLLAVVLGSGWMPCGCLVDEKCYVDSDCTEPQVCGAKGECELQCRADQDCDPRFGVSFVCTKGRCVEPSECTLCAFSHRSSTCVHGACQEGVCDPGFLDLNGNSGDGCEYACTPSGPELCDLIDNDCNGLVDEKTDLTTDPLNCGVCGHVCPTPPEAEPICSFGQCRYLCRTGHYDNNGRTDDGCEAAACSAKREECDGHDNDCNCWQDSNQDGILCGPGDQGVDEGFDHGSVTSCGPFCSVCSYPHAEASCLGGACRMGSCAPNWHDLDGVELNGCEYSCAPSGEERCDYQDNDCNGQVDEGRACQPLCPSDMLAIGSAYCIDRYEASRTDATAADQGQDDSLAVSRAQVMPWMINPMTSAQFAVFQAACRAAGKELCTRERWGTACGGPEQTAYVYGRTFDREACNCVDSFCDDYCTAQSIDPGACRTSADCGYGYDCFHAVPTGTFAACTNEYGTYDMNGNVWEIVASAGDPRGYEIRGGAFNCATAMQRVSCSYNAAWSELYAGFRCCKDVD